MARYLVVAHQTARSRELVVAVRRIARGDEEASFVLLVPATPLEHFFRAWTEGEARAVAEEQGEQAAERLRAAGVEVEAVRVGDANPLYAVEDELRDHPGYDRVVISTFPAGISRWLGMELPDRVARRSGLPVTHVVVEPSES